MRMKVAAIASQEREAQHASSSLSIRNSYHSEVDLTTWRTSSHFTEQKNLTNPVMDVVLDIQSASLW